MYAFLFLYSEMDWDTAGMAFVHNVQMYISVSTTVFKCHEHSQAQMLFF